VLASMNEKKNIQIHSSQKSSTEKNESTNRSSYEKMKKIIEDQNEVVESLKTEIEQSALKNVSDEKLERLSDNLQAAKQKLIKLVRMAMVEMKKHKNEHWEPIRVAVVDDF
jgi:hypothetical protein